MPCNPIENSPVSAASSRSGGANDVIFNES